MQARIIKEFHDKSNYGIVYKADSLVDFPTCRLEELKALGLVANFTDDIEHVSLKRGRKSKKND